ncbi:putative helicase MAGATAMA 3 [Corchorus olitorius]|uniref:Helicase MAGATAMA 3 n=1 Tax=Corchorus olitorius TaxID=93759 RepID=A0A1R3H5A7_9ROSI|nr:putative helicase MAGATAMA 3 [Corchorus olitorius]
MEYELCSIGPLLDVLRSLDEARVTQHLREINEKLVKQEYDPACDNAEVVNLMYEVLMFPVLLDDQSLFIEFERFIEAVDNMHELALAGHQQFPGVYALLFFNRRVRTVGYRLARSMGKLRRATDLEPLQPLIKKYIGFLENEVLPSTSDSRSKAQLDRSPIWLGITSLLEFLEPPAFEEGILERYPIFFDIVLNHISGDSPEFSHAVSCLRELFKMLALQDGEHEKQRRHFLYFLLHQVPIALLIIHRGYKMNPPCPPFECAHMWGPSLVSCLKDSSLHSSLQQPAFDLVQTIIVSDATALITSVLNSSTVSSIGRDTLIELDDEEENELSFTQDVEEKNISCWSEFSAQGKIASREYKDWMCIPMLWIDVLVEIDPPILPLSFSKAVLWARSRFPMVEPENSTELALDIRGWLSSSAAEISSTFGWKVPTGSDDGGGKESKNSMRLSTMCLPLVKTFNRLTAYFLVRMGQGELRKQWTWEPRMGESLILSLVDPNDNVRQFGKCILEQVSNTRGLGCGLKFLCSNSFSLSAVYLGLKHAMDLVRLDSVILKFQTLHHFFFVLCKLLKDEDLPKSDLVGSSSNAPHIMKYSSQGGFLKQPLFSSLPANEGGDHSNVDLKLRESFCYSLSEISWPTICKCLVEGKAFIDYSLCQMTCVRVLEILPVLFERLGPSFFRSFSESKVASGNLMDFKWLHDLMDWGKSQLKVVVVYWKKAIISLLNVLKVLKSDSSKSMVVAIENLISSDAVDMDELTEQVSRLCVALSKEVSCGTENSTSRSKKLFFGAFSGEGRYAASSVRASSIEETDVIVLDYLKVAERRNENNPIVLSDDENEKDIASDKSSKHLSHGVAELVSTYDHASETGHAKKDAHSTAANTPKDLLEAPIETDTSITKKEEFGKSSVKQQHSIKLKGPENQRKEISSNTESNVSSSQCRVVQKDKFDKSVKSNSINQGSNKVVSGTSDKILRELVHDAADDPLESAFRTARVQPSFLAKSGPLVPKRQVIQLKSPFDNRSGLQRLEAQVKRFKPPRLDDWYRPILEINFFVTVGLASEREDESRTVNKLKEVPVSFQSPEQYVNIFRPLVLEEFKAQLNHSFLEMSSWVDMYYGSVSVLSVERVDDFHLVRFVYDGDDSTGSKTFSENDLVLLTKEPPQSTSHDIHMVGKVERRERDNKRSSSILLIRFYLQNGTVRLNQARRQLLERSKWHASHIMSITPQLREFQALSSIKDIPLLPVILDPVNDSTMSDKPRVDFRKLSQPLQQILRSSFNDSQIQALNAAIGSQRTKKDFELSLIQGPPGTGKTRTIVAMVGVLLASLQRRTYESENSQNGDWKQSYRSSTNSRTRISQSTAIARAWQDAALARQLSEDVQRSESSIESCIRGRVLICAQSNAAVDELVSRISSDGLYGRDGKKYKPYLVRVGNAKTVHPNSLPFFIDTLVDQRLDEEKMHTSDARKDSNLESSSMVLRSNLEKLVENIRFYETKRANIRDGNSDMKKTLEDGADKATDVKEMSDKEIEIKLRRLYEQKKQMYKDLSAAQAQEKKINEETKSLRHKLRKSILKEAEIVVTTLSGCGGDLYGVCAETMSNFKFGNPSEQTLFDAVVIDEAAQALEPATLIPLQLLKSRGTKCIMVGDPKQLPATVLSNVASKFMYECSMFERLQKAGHPVIMLTQQYRMHPEICHFPSLHFYDKKLLNGDTMSSKSASFHGTEGLGPYVFYDVVDGQELRGKNSGALSLYNEREADAAVELIRYPSEFVGGRIGVITPYKCQLSHLRSRFSSAFGSSVTADIEFNTVDGFQGREVDILVLSTVRASDSSSSPGIGSSSIGFVADVRRMNVALTRARLSLWILGNARTLQTNHNWAALVKDAKQRNLVLSIKRPYNTIFKISARNNPIPEDSVNHPSEVKHTAKVGGTCQPGEQNRHREKLKFEEKRKHNGSLAHGNRTIAEDDDSDRRKDLHFSKRRAKDDCDPPIGRNISSASANFDKRKSQNVKSTNSERVSTSNGSQEKEGGKVKTKLGKNHVDEKKGDENTGQVGHSEKNRKSDMLKGSKKSSGHEQRSTPGPDDNKKDRQTNEGGGDPKEATTSQNLIAKRKKQREAVDAILYSALIPSKKSEQSTKTLHQKRPSSPHSAVSGGIKPSKKRKGEPRPL